MEYRVDQSRGQYDFDLHNSDGSVAAVEVTSSVDQLIEGIPRVTRVWHRVLAFLPPIRKRGPRFTAVILSLTFLAD